MNRITYIPRVAKSGREFRPVIRVMQSGRMVGAKYGPKLYSDPLAADIAATLAANRAASILFPAFPVSIR